MQRIQSFRGVIILSYALPLVLPLTETACRRRFPSKDRPSAVGMREIALFGYQLVSEKARTAKLVGLEPVSGSTT